MIYGSVCSGIEAATCAWHPLGWKPAWFAEIDPFCSALLRHHYPDVRNYGDFTTIRRKWLDRIESTPIDLLVGGTPCQDFSVAGLRAGLDGARGDLTLEYLKLARRLRPRWLVWENVPGVLSIDGGRAFGTFLGGLAELGYGFAYRVLDAQYFGVPQRRRRVFVVGYLGDWRYPAAVLFERESMSRFAPPSLQAGQETAGTLGGGSGSRGWCPDTDRMTFIPTRAGVRRLTPREAEFLQGFPRGYTLIPYRGKPAADGPRYRAIGNSMAVPVMNWIGQRIEHVDTLLRA